MLDIQHLSFAVTNEAAGKEILHDITLTVDNGLPEELPTAIVDLDHSATSRNLTRQFTTVSSLSITTEYTSFTEARKAMQKSEIFGFVIIPPSFEADLYANRRPEISYDTNSA